MKNFIKALLLIIVVCIFLFLFYCLADILFAPSSEKNFQVEVCYKNNCFITELAKTPDELLKGLMDRQQLDQDRGMLFVFWKDGTYPFWMKNTLISLDIIWLDKNGKIVFINKNSQPCPVSKKDCPLINPEVSARYVLEVNAGIADKIGIKKGDIMEINSKRW